MAERGFILTPTYRVHGGRPAVHLYAVLESGEPALVIDDRAAPHFFVAARDAGRVRAVSVTPTALRTFADEPVARVDVTLPGDAAASAAGSPTRASSATRLTFASPIAG